MGALCGTAKPSAAEKAEQKRANELAAMMDAKRATEDAIHKLLLLGADSINTASSYS